MKTEYRHAISFVIGITVFGLLCYQTWLFPPNIKNLPIGLLFVFLIVFTTSVGVPISGGIVSLLPLSTIAAFLVLDSILACWVAFIGAYINEAVRWGFGEKLGPSRRLSKFGTIAVASANASVQTISIFIGGWLYKWVGGEVPYIQISIENIWPLLLLSVIYLLSNLTLIAGYMFARGREVLLGYLNSLPNLFLFEGTSLIFLPLFPLIFNHLGIWIFTLFALVIVVGSWISRGLALTTRGLERRVQELDSLQAVGQALSANLRLDKLFPAIYEQVARLMPAENFYVALYFPDADEVIFPLAMENDDIVVWRPRSAGKGITEYVINTKTPLLIPTNIAEIMSRLGIDQHGRMATSWLGVPILAGEEPLGVIAVQSYDETERYDDSHKEVLVTIAAQAGIAIQNARLYERTDEALERRVQELNSILRTASEGMLLLSLDLRILAANKALADFLGIAQTELSGGDWGSVSLHTYPSLVAMLGYTNEELESDLNSLEEGILFESVNRFCNSDVPERFFERTITPVLGRNDEIAGWLIVLREVTEEIELSRLKEDMTHMLVHDLRSPLTALRGSLWIIRQDLGNFPADSPAHNMVAMAERNADRMISMVNSLLDIAKLESNQLVLQLEEVSISGLFKEIANRISQLVTDAQIQFKILSPSEDFNIHVDMEHIRRVIINLLDNAIKFTPDGGTVTLWAKKDRKEASTPIFIGVTDTGTGIAPEVQEKLFQKFHTDAGTKGRRRGTGLGLAYSKLVVETHGGDIWVESQLGQGSTFFIRLPNSRI